MAIRDLFPRLFSDKKRDHCCPMEIWLGKVARLWDFPQVLSGLPQCIWCLKKTLVAFIADWDFLFRKKRFLGKADAEIRWKNKGNILEIVIVRDISGVHRGNWYDEEFRNQDYLFFKRIEEAYLKRPKRIIFRLVAKKHVESMRSMIPRCVPIIMVFRFDLGHTEFFKHHMVTESEPVNSNRRCE